MAQLNKNIWNSFTNQYSLSKTLRFELKPIGKTKELIRQVQDEKEFTSPLAPLILQDEEKGEAYKQVKELFDKLHCEFLNFALDKDNITDQQREAFNEALQSFFETYKKDKTSNQLIVIQKKLAKKLTQLLDNNIPAFLNTLKPQLEIAKQSINTQEQKLDSLKKTRKKLPQEIKNASNSTNLSELRKKRAELDRKIKAINNDIKELKKCTKFSDLSSSKTQIIFTLARLFYINDNQVLKTLKEFDGFISYFGGFNKTRANVYDTKGTGEGNNWHFLSTSISHRLFEQNLKFHCNNILKWQIIKESIHQNNDLLNEKNWHWQDKLKEIERELSFNANEFFSLELFSDFFSQNGIDKYNQILVGIPTEAGQKKQQGLNEIINLTRQQINGNKKKFPLLQEAYKQILSQREGSFIDAFKTKEEIREKVNDFIESQKEILSNLNSSSDGFISLINEIKNQEEVYLSTESLRFISNDLTGNWNIITTWYLDSLNKGKVKESKRKVFGINELQSAFNKKQWGLHLLEIQIKYLNEK